MKIINKYKGRKVKKKKKKKFFKMFVGDEKGQFLCSKGFQGYPCIGIWKKTRKEKEKRKQKNKKQKSK